LPDPQAIKTVGFVGLGRMGLPMAARLAEAGYDVRGFDISQAARAALRAKAPAARAAGSLTEAAADADAIVLMLPDSKAIAAVARSQGLLTAMRPGSLLIDMSSAEPAATAELAAEARAKDIWLVGAPVSGGVTGAAGGTLTIMAGGHPAAVARARPLLDELGSRVVHVGSAPGAGHALKALNNLVSAIHMLATSEAMLAGQRFGLDPAVMLDVINTSSGRSGSTQNKWPNYVLPGGYDSGFAMQLQVKDAMIGLAIERDFGPGARLAELAVELWRRAANWLPASADHTEIVRWLEQTREGLADLRSDGHQGAVWKAEVMIPPPSRTPAGAGRIAAQRAGR
jgi:3-hydroxyisobutyrate dehydrogenase